MPYYTLHCSLYLESQTELVIKTNDGIEMITAINSLELQSGGDCPEHAMDGLEACKTFITS